jgi:hypothetical protein
MSFSKISIQDHYLFLFNIYNVYKYTFEEKMIKYISYSQTVPQFVFLSDYYCRGYLLLKKENDEISFKFHSYRCLRVCRYMSGLGLPSTCSSFKTLHGL